MNSGELAGGNNTPEKNSECLHEQAEACKAFAEERVSLNETIDTSFLSLPEQAQSYLSEHCATNQVTQIAAQEAAKLLEANPTILDDPDMLNLLLSDCIETAEIVVKTAELDKIETTTEVLSRLNVVARREFENGGNIDDKLKRIQAVFADEEVALKQIAIFRKTLTDLRGAIDDPQEQAAFEAMLASVPFDLSATDTTSMFAPVLAEVEKSEVFSAETKNCLRNIVTGTDVQDALAEKNADGSFVNSEDNKREFRTGVSGYTEPSGRQIIEAKVGNHPAVTKDVSGWSGEDIGLLVEVMHYWNTTESFGTTGLVENIYKIDFSILDSGGAFDPLTVNRFRQVISHMTGGYAGYDGDIENFEHQQRLIQNQSRLLSETQTAFGWENSQSGTSKVLQRLGLENVDGNPNFEVIAAFGDYTQENYATGHPDQLAVVDYLSRLYPQYVFPLSEV